MPKLIQTIYKLHICSGVVLKYTLYDSFKKQKGYVILSSKKKFFLWIIVFIKISINLKLRKKYDKLLVTNRLMWLVHTEQRSDCVLQIEVFIIWKVLKCNVHCTLYRLIEQCSNTSVFYTWYWFKLYNHILQLQQKKNECR